MTNTMSTESKKHHQRYPLAKAVPKHVLDKEVEQLARARSLPLLRRMSFYVGLGGPGFLGAALTLGAGTMTAAMLAGSMFAYRTLWIFLVAVISGAFMLAAMARFTCKGGFSLIRVQQQRHGKLLGIVLAPIIGVVAVAIVFNFGQYALGTHLIESVAAVVGVSFPAEINWIVFFALTSWMTLSYGRGRKGTVLVERFMKYGLALITICFCIRFTSHPL